MRSTASLMSSDVNLDHARWVETLRDSTTVRIRPITPQDAGKERAFLDALSPNARRFRFRGQLSRPTSALVGNFGEIDYMHHIDFAAILPDGAKTNGTKTDGTKETFLCISGYSTSEDGSSCECTIMVLDEWHHRGLGTVLMKHLIEVAMSRGILYMFSVDAVDNVEMAEFVKHVGFTRHIDPKDPTQAVDGLWL